MYKSPVASYKQKKSYGASSSSTSYQKEEQVVVVAPGCSCRKVMPCRGTCRGTCRGPTTFYQK
jgi:hypothetical protein